MKKQQSPVILDLCLRKTRAFPNSSGLNSVFEKLRFRDGLVWAVGLNVEIKLRFQISLCGRGLK